MSGWCRVAAMTVALLAGCRGGVVSESTKAPSRPVLTRASMDLEHLRHIEPLVQRALRDERAPGCVVVIGRHDGVVYQRAFGHRSVQPGSTPMTLETVFDLASLTKPIATATAVMCLVERGLVRLRDPVAVSLPEFGTRGKERITVQQLLTHVGGLIPDNALEDYQHGVDEAWRRLFDLEPTDPPGTRFSYTDVGFEVLGKLVERVSGRPLDQFVAAEILTPWGMTETGFRPAAALRQRAAPTEQREGRWMQGEVHDPRAYLLGGVAGHAGLFSTAHDLARYARGMLAGGLLDGVRVLSPSTVALMTAAHDVPGGTRGLGWDKRSRFSSNRGELMSEEAFGHGGFTGTALWIDPTLDLFVLFLSNRVHPDGRGSVNRLAGQIATVAAAAVGREANGASAMSSPAVVPRRVSRRSREAVLPGIDVLERDHFALLRGRRVGLITNHTGRTRDGRRTIDLLHESSEVELTTLWSPEHGLEGVRDGRVGDATDEATGLPVFSLYGETRSPAAEALKRVDVIVFDIQDIGTRFYTYISTMGLAMEAAADAGVAFVVLDRPNPLGRSRSGSVCDQERLSFVAHHAIPVRHGLTVGELARLIAVERSLDLELTVVPVAGWDGAWFDETGLPWVNPSPNMRTLHQALLYPGLGLWEFTNLSVGRGTDTPFERIGAPWLDGAALGAHLQSSGLEGLAFSPVTFTPTASKFAGEECSGVHILVTHRDRVDAERLGWAVATFLRDHHGDAWNVERWDALLLHARQEMAFKEGASVESLMALGAADRDGFEARVRRALDGGTP